MGEVGDEIAKRFWGQVDRKDDPAADWPWAGVVRADGYGVFNCGVRQVLTHRLALQLSGEVIPTGAIVMQTCGNRLCCNPAHLRIGTRADQMQERSRVRGVPRVGKPEREDPQSR